ncbi:MAG: response regulator [bacterium]|nr:response regulator [bacterium]
MNIAHKVLAGSVLIAGLIVQVTRHAGAVVEKEQLDTIQDQAALRAEALSDELGRALAVRVSECLSYSRTPLVQESLLNSNFRFGGLADVGAYLEEQDVLWQARAGAKPTPLMQAVGEGPLAQDLETVLIGLSTQSGTPAFVKALVTNRHGAIVAQTETTAEYPQADRPWWRAAVEEGVHVTDAHFGVNPPRHSINICVRVDSPGEQGVGVLKAELDLREVLNILDRRTEDSFSDYRARLYLFTGERRLIHRGGWTTPLPLPDGKQWFQGIGRGEDWAVKSIERHDPSLDTTMLATYAVLAGQGDFPGLGWTVLLEVDHRDILAPIHALQGRLRLLSMAAGLAVLLVGGFFAMRLSRRFAHIEEAALALAQGSFETRTDVDGEDEVTRLGTHLNQIGRQLRTTSQDTLRQNASTRAKNRMLRQEIGIRSMVEQQLTVAKDAAENAERAKSDFLANMSHEIRTPMNGIIGMTSLLLETKLDGEQESFAKTVSSCAGSLLTLLNDILDFSKIEAGMLEFENLPFDLGETIEDVLDILAARASETGLELLSDVSAEVSTALCGDAGRLRQILMNLAGNALKFTHDGHVLVRVERDPDDGEEGRIRLRIRVEDTGIGIPKERLDRLFKSFSQVDASTTREYGGTGLGLAISKRLVEQMGGEIGVESEEGEGSTFWFTTSLEQQAVSHEAIQGDFGGLRVLLVADNSVSLGVTERLLINWGCSVTTMDSSAVVEALVSARSEGASYEVVVIDSRGAVGLSERINGDDRVAETPLVIVLPMTAKSEIERARELGTVCLLTKPLKASRLRAALQPIVDPAHSEVRPTALASEEPVSLRLQDGRLLSVLVAEDNPVNQLMARKILEKLDVSADFVDDGSQALEAIRNGSYDIVLMDCQMPVMDGFVATREIRALDGPEADVRIVALTANAMKGDKERCLAAGMDDYLAKPFTKGELSEVLGRELCESVSKDPQL